MDEWIPTLDNASAVAVLGAFVSSASWQHSAELSSDEEAREILRDLARHIDHEHVAVADGELARAALDVLYQEPKNRSRLDQLSEAAELESVGVLETLGLAAMVLAVLQTHVRIERDKQGRVGLLIDKRPTESRALETLMQKLLAWSSTAPR